MGASKGGGYQPIPPFDDWVAMVSSPLDSALDSALERLTSVREAVEAPPDDLSTKRSLLLAALHTGAVEGVHRMNRGVTLTALDNALHWQRFVEDAEGSDARRHVEAALRAYDLAVDAARTDAMPISQAWIRRVHEEACAAQTTVTVRTPVGEQTVPLRRGEYKRYENHVLLPDGRIHHYAPPEQVGPEMERLVDQLRSPAYGAAEAVVQAAYAHHALTQIHPFQDGNGRVARVLASVPLLRSSSLPFHLYEDQVGEYFAALAKADGGDPADFVRFVSERTTDLALLTADRLVADTQLDFPAYTDDGNRELAALTANRLRQLVEEALADIADASAVPEVVAISRQSMGFPRGTPDSAGRRTANSDNPSWSLLLRPTGATQDLWFAWAVDFTLRSDRPFALWRNWKGDSLELRLDDVHPEITTNARLRVRAFIERAVKEELMALRETIVDRPRRLTGEQGAFTLGALNPMSWS